MNNPLKVILCIYGVSIGLCIAYAIYLITTVHVSATLGIPFTFIAVTALVLFSETILLTLVFITRLKEVWALLLLVFLITGVVPIYFLMS